ncbi:MAG TPA: DUF3999 family protein [Polyangiales bacterium]|nr:DUF3999 family protein [Polyangiales bacterium]
MKPWLLLLAVPSVAHAAPPARDFAYGVELAPLSKQAFHRYPLPGSVLRMVTTRELADLCVYDAAGRPEAHALVWPREPAPAISEQPLSVFPLEISRDTAGVEVKIERDPVGQILRTLSQPLVDAKQRAYLLDAHALEGRLTGLNLTLAGAPDNVMLDVRIESSQDLTTFEELTRTTLARLAHDGQSLTRTSVELSTVPAYLRLSFDPGVSAVALEKATGRVERASASAPLEAIELDATPGERDAQAEQEFRYLLPFGPRAARYSVLLPSGTQLVQGTLFGADAEDAPLLALDRQVYRTPPSAYPLVQSRTRVLELRVDDAGGGVRAGAPKLRVEYLAPSLLFAGDGTPPFTLAYGSASARCTPLASDVLELEAPARASVRAVRTLALGGPTRLTKPEQDKSPRVYVLWSALLIAVGVLGVIARRLLRSV